MMLERILNLLMIMAESEGVGLNRLQFTTSTPICLALMPVSGEEGGASTFSRAYLPTRHADAPHLSSSAGPPRMRT